MENKHSFKEASGQLIDASENGDFKTVGKLLQREDGKR